jgi:DNA-binding XRE family transcriptional regulator
MSKYDITCINKKFNDLTLDEFRFMRRNDRRLVKLDEFLPFYNIDIVEYCNFVKNTKGLKLAIDERRKLNEYISKNDSIKDKPKELFKGIEIQAFRMLRGFTTTKLGRAIHIDEQSIKKFEKMKTTPSWVSDKYISYLKISENEIKRLQKYLNGETKSFELEREIPVFIKNEVRKKYKNKCGKCGKNKGLHFHHIQYFSEGGLHVVDNLLLLCSSCHADVHKGEKAYHLLKKMAEE